MTIVLINTLVLPLALGLLLGLLQGRLGRAQALALGLAVLAVYVVLEGFPAIPPASGKQKLACLLVLAVALAHLPRPRVVMPLFLLATALWLGWPKLSQASLGAEALVLGLPALAAALPRPESAERAFLLPAAVMVFGLGAAALSVLGVFMGFAQASGAMVALLGGVVGVAYLRGIVTGQWHVLTPQAENLALMSLAALSLMIALFAPDVSLAAYALLSLTLAVPAIAPAFTRQSAALRPFLFAALAALPAALAVLLAYASVTPAS